MSRYYICTNCWRILPESKAFFECSECTHERNGYLTRPDIEYAPHNDQQNRRRVANIYKWWDNFLSTDAILQCPTHPDTKLELFCECRERLPQTSMIEREDARLAIRIVGASGAGKTLFTAAICHEFKALKNGIALLGIGNTGERFARIEDDLFVRGQKPPANLLGSRPDQCYAWKMLRKNQPKTEHRSYPILATQDLAGEVWERLATRDCSTELNRYLNYPGDVIFIIDGAEMAMEIGLEPVDAWDPHRGKNRTAIERMILTNIFNFLAKNRINEMRLALVITKADLLVDPNGTFDLPEITLGQNDSTSEAALTQWLDRSLRGDFLIIAEQFKEFRLFASSSLGFRPTQDDVDSEGMLRKRINPKGVIDPILWLLDR